MLYEFDRDLVHQHDVDYLVDVDEAGRGPLAGPVVVSAVILDLTKPIEDLNDSKKLSEAKRARLAPQITSRAIISVITIVSEEVIDKINILQATLQGMYTSVESWSNNSRALIAVDGNQRIPWYRMRSMKLL